MVEGSWIVCDQCGNEVAEAEVVTVPVRTRLRGRPQTLDLCPASATDANVGAVVATVSDMSIHDR